MIASLMVVMLQSCWTTLQRSPVRRMQHRTEDRYAGFKWSTPLNHWLKQVAVELYLVLIYLLLPLEMVLSCKAGGQSWTVPLGRRDARTASQSAANSQLPAPSSNLATLISGFSAKGFTAAEMTVLSGAHTIGQAGCENFRNRIYNQTNIDPAFATTRRANCPSTTGSGDRNLAPLDVQTPTRFENTYFQNLVDKRGLLNSDQVLFNNGSQDAVVQTYSQNNARFLADFAAAMVKMGNLSPAPGTVTEIRRNCRMTN